MPLDKIGDSIKSWVDQRVKSPYFANVFIIWIILNKALVFSILNFSEQWSLEARMAWVRSYLHSFNFGPFWGFSGSIAASFILAIPSTFIFNLINGVGTSAHRLANSMTVSIVRLSERERWVKIGLYQELGEMYGKIRGEFEDAKSELRKLIAQANVTNSSLDQKQKDFDALQKVEAGLRSEIVQLKEAALSSKNIQIALRSDILKTNPFLFLNGEWKVETSLNGVIKNEVWEIDETGSVHISGGNSFKISNINASDGHISFSKAGLGKTRYHLIFRNDNQLEGLQIENNGNNLVLSMQRIGTLGIERM